jgi:hypothetical protein
VKVFSSPSVAASPTTPTDRPVIPDIPSFTKMCLIGIVRIPVHDLFHQAIAVTRECCSIPNPSINLTYRTLADIARDVSEPDVRQLVDSMNGHLYRDFDGDLIHESSSE